MRTATATVATLLLCTAMAACNPGGNKEDAQQRPTTATSPTDTPGSEQPGTFDEQDYSYVLALICRCPYTGPVEVTVDGGQVTSAVALASTNAVAEGDPAPEALHLTISDILAKADDPTAARTDVQWPPGQDWPDRVRVELVAGARDADITYVISDVRLGGAGPAG
jgi:hypothetical protein